MKTKVLFLLITLLSLHATHAQRVPGARVGYIDMEYILENVQEYQEANKQLEEKAQRWTSQIKKKQNAIDQMKKDLSAERVLLTKELIEEREEEITILEEELIKYQQDRFGPFGSLVGQRNNLVKPIQDQVFVAVQEIAKNKRYDFVFDKSADVVMLYSDKKFDISDLVLRSINRTRKQGERKAKNKAASKKQKFDDVKAEPVVNPEVEARKKAADEKRAERVRLLEERKAQKLKEREEKKKAYEERRKKLLEEREAKKKAAAEKRKKATQGGGANDGDGGSSDEEEKDN